MSLPVHGAFDTAEFQNAKHVDLGLREMHPRLTTWVASVSDTGQTAFELYPSTKSSGVSVTLFHRAVQMLVQNFIKNPETRFFALSKSWSDYPSEPTRYDRHPLALSAVIAATEFLRDQDWILIYPGSKQAGLRTRLEVLPKFRDALAYEGFDRLKITAPKGDEIILLRDANKELCNYDETKKTATVRRQLHKINQFLESHHVMHGGRRLNTHLVRIFKNSFVEGGRFYRAEHLALKSEQRSEILINGEATCEVDFSCLHINMLYIKETGKAFEGDAYEVSGSKIPRDIFKVILQIILNCDSEMSAILATQQKLQANGLFISAEKVMETFLRKHAAIQKHFFTGAGLKLQFEDSCIAELVLLKALEKEIPVLPVHDSFICLVADVEWLIETMYEASAEVLGAKLPLKAKTGAARAA